MDEWHGYLHIQVTSYPVSYYGYYNTLNEACIDGPNNVHYLIYTPSPTLSIGVRLYLDENLTTPFGGFVGGYYHLSTGDVFTNDANGYITSLESCSIVTRYSYGISRGISSSYSACKSIVSDVIFINSQFSDEVNIGDTCYTSASGAAVFVGNPYKWYQVDNGVDGAYAVQIDSLGRIFNNPLACGFV